MKMPTILKRKKLRATTTRRSRGLGLPAAMDYEQMSEPNMKLSRALLIVLVLHIVAVAGIIAFNTIKTRESLTASPVEAAAAVPQTLPDAAPEVAPGSTPMTMAAPNEMRQVAARTETRAPEKKVEPPKQKPKPEIPAIADSGEIYTVVKGDNPVTIARHFHVNYDALLQLNQIEDPRKLQIGTKLHIPAREKAAEKSN